MSRVGLFLPQTQHCLITQLCRGAPLAEHSNKRLNLNKRNHTNSFFCSLFFLITLFKKLRLNE